VIAGQFFGHTHYDEFQLFYDEEDYHVTSVAYIGPSVTPYYGLNPGYRLYTIDGNYDTSKMVLDHETWILDLKYANYHGVAEWKPLYSAMKTYKMPSLLPVEWDRLVSKMINNDDLFKLYYKLYWKASVERPTCDADCKKRMLCDLVSGRSHNRKETCKSLEARLAVRSQEDWTSFLLNGFALTFSVLVVLPLTFALPGILVGLG